MMPLRVSAISNSTDVTLPRGIAYQPIWAVQQPVFQAAAARVIFQQR